jgi:hypothetical protein
MSMTRTVAVSPGRGTHPLGIAKASRVKGPEWLGLAHEYLASGQTFILEEYPGMKFECFLIPAEWPSDVESP